MKIPGYAGTLTGTALGAAAVGLGLAALPLALPIGAAAGIIVDLLRRKHPAPPPQVMQSIMHFVPAPAQNAPAVAQASAKAAVSPPLQAVVLHSYLRAHPNLRVNMSRDLVLWTLISNFQVAFNNDPNAVKAFGGRKLAHNYKFDGPTAAALAFYTHDNIAPDPASFLPTDAPGSTSGSSASVSASASFGADKDMP